MRTIVTNFIKTVDKYISPLIWVSIVLLFVELTTGSKNSLEGGMYVFLWIERLTATVFMLEYFCRWYEDHTTDDANDAEVEIGHSYYPLSVMGWVDLLAWLPFLVGFFVPAYALGWVRALRVLRVFKMFRYSRNLQLFALAVYRSWWLLRAILFIAFCSGLLACVLLHEVEKGVNEDFANIWNVAWFVVVSDTTVGYGDMSPVTPLGKSLCTLLIFLPGIAVVAAAFGVVGTAVGEVMEQEKDPDFDPLKEFLVEYVNERNRRNRG